MECKHDSNTNDYSPPCFLCKVEELEGQLNAMTQERDDLLQARAICPECAKKIDEAAGIDLVGLNRQLAASQAYAQQLREALKFVRLTPEENAYWLTQLDAAIALPQDDTALREWGAKLLEEMAEILDRGADYELYIPILRRKAAELRARK